MHSVKTFLSAFALFVTALASAPAAQAEPQRIVSIGGSLTEIVYALGQQDRLVARDSTSTYPPAALELPNIGYARALAPEGVLSVQPDLVLATEGSGPPETMDVLTASSVPLIVVPTPFSVDGVYSKIEAVGAALGAQPQAEALIAQVRAEIEAVRAQVAQNANGATPKVLFIISAANGRLIAAGDDTPAQAIIALAGGQNALSGFVGFKPVTEEAVLTAAPDAVLMMDRHGPHAISDDDLFALPALSSTPAAQARRVIRMDGIHLLGFGPRTASAIADLAAALHGADPS